MQKNIFLIRVLGLSGVLGGLLLFAGDMLFYYDPVSTDFQTNMGNASDFRIIASAVTALIASWLYMVGVLQVRHAFKPAKTIIRNTVLVCFGAIAIAYGVVHGAFVSIATSARLATENNLNMNEAVSLAAEANDTLRLFVYPFFGLLSIVFITQVWKRRTLYPRWIILFFPLIPFLIQDIVCKNLTGSIYNVICGGYLNLILIIFFAASTVALWNTKDPDSTTTE